MMIWMWTALVALVGYVLYRDMHADVKRKELTLTLRGLLVEMEQAEATFDAHTSHAAGYFDHHKKERWKTQYHQLHALAAGLPFASSNLTLSEKETCRSFLDHYHRAEAIREAFYETFVPVELRRTPPRRII